MMNPLDFQFAQNNRTPTPLHNPSASDQGSSLKRRTPSPTDAPEIESQTLKRANIKQIELEPEILDASDSAEAAEPKISRFLTYLVTIFEPHLKQIIQIEKKNNLYVVKTLKETYSFSLSTEQQLALTNLRAIRSEDLLPIFKSRIHCEIDGVTFNFSLFFLIYFEEIDFFNTLREKGVGFNLAFQAHAAKYILSPLSHSFINPHYYFLIPRYLYHLSKLNPQRQIVCYPGYESIIKEYANLQLRPYADKCEFDFELALITEAKLACQPSSPAPTFYLKQMKHFFYSNPSAVVTNNKLFLPNKEGENRIYEGVELVKFLKELICKNSQINLAVMLGVEAKHITDLFVEGTSNLGDRISFTYDKKRYYVTLTTNQSIFIQRLSPLLNNSKHLADALLHPVTLHDQASGKTIGIVSLMSLFFLSSPVTQSLIFHIRERFHSNIPANLIGAAAKYAIAPFLANNTSYLNPDYYKYINEFHNNLIFLNGGNDQFPTDLPFEKMVLNRIEWKFTPGEISNPPPNTYSVEATNIEERKGNLRTKHYRNWEIFLSKITLLQGEIFTFIYKGQIHEIDGCVALSPLFKMIIEDASQPAPVVEALEAPRPVEAVTIDIDLKRAKAFLPALLRPLTLDENFTHIIERINSDYQITVISKEKIYRFIMTDLQFKVLFKTIIIPAAFYSGIQVHKIEGNNSTLIGRTSLFSIFYDDNPFVQEIIKSLQKQPLDDDFFSNATFFATHPFFAKGLYVNPELLNLTNVFHKHLIRLNHNRLDEFTVFYHESYGSVPNITIGSSVWKFNKRSRIQESENNLYYYEATYAQISPKTFKTLHTASWEQFLSKVSIITASDHACTLAFYHNNARHLLSGHCVSQNTAFQNVINAEAPQPVAPVEEVYRDYGLFKERLKTLLAPFDPYFDGETLKDGFGNTLTLNLNESQQDCLHGIVPLTLTPESLIVSIPVTLHTPQGLEFKYQTCLLALFYGKTEINDQIIKHLKKGSINIEFLNRAAQFALWPFILNLSPKYYGAYIRPDLVQKTEILLEYLDELNYIKGSFNYPVNASTNVRVGKKNWAIKPCPNIARAPNLYYTEAESCCTTTDLTTSHTLLWKSFLAKIDSVRIAGDPFVFMYNKKRIAIPGGIAVSENDIFKNILSENPQTVNVSPPEQPQTIVAAPKQVQAPQIVNPEIVYAKIGSVIEKYWFQNAVNYSIWIKLLRQSKGVFAFESLPKQLMEPLKGFKKEDVDYILRFFGVGALCQGDLPDDLVEKSIPTLLRVKAAEFKLLKGSFTQTRIKPEVIKPCYLVKPGTRFVHIIKVSAWFDSYGLISGFILNGEAPVEKQISLEEFNKLVEEGKQKKIIVLQRETVKLVEEDPAEDLPPRVKRARDEDEKKIEAQRDPKEARAEPILPPVPQARVLKRQAENEGTVHPKAPKESKFNDKSDITTDKLRAVGKPLDGGIIAPPEMIDHPPAPEMQNALTLDDLFSALSANAGAQVNHVVMSSINSIKAIFTEEPLVYEGLEHISKLEKTPKPSSPCIVPKAKKYQWDYVLEAKRRDNAGLGTILAPYMGLGKTWIYVSKVLLDIYEGAKGHHLIITPKPLRKTIADDAIVILNNARLNAFIHLKSLKWGDFCATRLIKESHHNEKEFLLSLLGLFNEEDFNKIMMGRGPLVNELITTFVGSKYQQYPSKMKRLYEFCKNSAPKDLPERGRYDEKGLERILTFSSSFIKKCEEGKDLVRHAKDDQPLIIIASYEQASHLVENPVCTPGCSSLIFDEAQYIHNPETNIAKWADSLLKLLSPKSKIAVTGTPIENGVEDLFQLVGLVAPQLKCPAILTTLSSLSTNASRYVKSKQTELALAHLLKFHGHLQAYLERISNNLVLVLAKTDPRVKEAWGEGAQLRYHYEKIDLPELAKRKYQEAHELFKTRKVDPVTGKKLDSNMAYYARVAAIMLDPELQVTNLTPKDSSVQRLLKWIKNEAKMEDIDRLIARSALLTSIIHSPVTAQAVQDKRVGLIFIANIAVGKVVRKVLKKKFQETQGAESYLMYGDQKEEKKDNIISKLKETGKLKFGILSLESGSTGFSIPEAALTIIPSLSYNVATELQAIGRMDRATSKGVKDVVYPIFGIFSEEHIPVIQMIKKLTYKNFFAAAPTQMERLKDMAQLIRNNIYQSYLNEKRDAALAKKEMEAIDAIIDTFLNDIEEEDLKEFVTRLTPALPKYVPQPAKVAIVAKGTLPALQQSFVRSSDSAPAIKPAAAAPVASVKIPGNKLFKLPLPNSLSNEDKIRLAAFIQQNRKELEAPIKEIYSSFKDPNIRILVRQGQTMPSQEASKAYSTLLNLIRDAKMHIASVGDIGQDIFVIEGQDYVRKEQINPSSTIRIKLCRGTNDVLEILI